MGECTMKNLKKHKWADVIHAYADGYEVQYRVKNTGQWNTADAPFFDDNTLDLEWRVKPNIVTQRFRMALTTMGVIAVNIDNSSLDNPVEYDVIGFIQWVGSPASIEVEEF